MKPAKPDWLMLLIESINCIVIQYALSNMIMLMQTNPLVILLSAAKIWTWSRYWSSVKEICPNKILRTVLFAVCFAGSLTLLYFAGHAAGEIVPF